jgi:hypothetical protein
MLAEKAGKMKYVQVGDHSVPTTSTAIACVGDLPRPVKEMKPEMQVVGEHWPTLGEDRAGALVTAIMAQNPDAL